MAEFRIIVTCINNSGTALDFAVNTEGTDTAEEACELFARRIYDNQQNVRIVTQDVRDGSWVTLDLSKFDALRVAPSESEA